VSPISSASRPKARIYELLDGLFYGAVTIAAIVAVNAAEDWRASLWSFIAIFAVFIAVRTARAKLEKKRVGAAAAPFLLALTLMFVVPWSALGLDAKLPLILGLCAAGVALQLALGFLAGWGVILKRRF